MYVRPDTIARLPLVKFLAEFRTRDFYEYVSAHFDLGRRQSKITETLHEDLRTFWYLVVLIFVIKTDAWGKNRDERSIGRYLMSESRWGRAGHIDCNLPSYDISMMIDCKPVAKIQRQFCTHSACEGSPACLCSPVTNITSLYRKDNECARNVSDLSSFPNLLAYMYWITIHLTTYVVEHE